VAVTVVGPQSEIRFVCATSERVVDVLGVLDEAAAWLRAGGIRQWPVRFEAAWILDAIGRGETWLVMLGDRICGTVTLDWSDPLWSDVGGAGAPAGGLPSGYVHRMAVRRRAAGLGAVMLEWAAESARQRGCAALRLDCVATNRRLRAYYESVGFVHCGDVGVGGAPGQRLAGGPTTVVSRYERLLGQAE
jgi:GNAT superfamily N-acetyltransferase